MATMKLNRAFSSKFLTKLIRYVVADGSYDANNEWVPGVDTPEVFYGVIVTGNRFSRDSKGISRVAMESGERFSNYKSLYYEDKWPELEMDDKIYYKNTYYNVLQHTDEEVFGFHGFIIEKSKDWSPTI